MEHQLVLIASLHRPLDKLIEDSDEVTWVTYIEPLLNSVLAYAVAGGSETEALESDLDELLYSEASRNNLDEELLGILLDEILDKLKTYIEVSPGVDYASRFLFLSGKLVVLNVIDDIIGMEQ